MKVIDCQQGSEEWFRARMGIPTASAFKAISNTEKSRGAWRTLLCRCLSESMTDEPADSASAAFMARGTALESKARLFYELEFDVEVKQVGLVTLGDGSAGCSPDGLVGDDGGLEIKVPSATKHVAYMLDPDSLVAAYRMQVQGSLFVTGRRWWDLMSYSPCMPHVLFRCERDDKLIAALAGAVADLHAKKIEALIRFGYMEPPGSTTEQPPAAPMTIEDLFDPTGPANQGAFS